MYMHHYRILLGSLNWIHTCMRPELTPALEFLIAYNHHTSTNYIKSTIYSLWYIHSTPEFGINFSSANYTEPHSQIHHIFPYYNEAYWCLFYNAHLPTWINGLLRCLLGIKSGENNKKIIYLEIFKYRSITSFIIFRYGGLSYGNHPTNPKVPVRQRSDPLINAPLYNICGVSYQTYHKLNFPFQPNSTTTTMHV